MTSAFTTPSSVALFRRLLWEGTVPLEVHIDSKELPAGSDRGLDSCYLQAPRISYLPLLIPEIKRFLTDLVFDEAAAKNTKEEDWWFENEEGALMKWHLPVGLLYDMHTTSTRLFPDLSSQIAPMRLILHLASPPSDKLLMAPSQETCKQMFMSQLKEADFLRWGSTKRVTGLRKQDQDGLWESIREHNFDSFWRIASKIMPMTSPSSPSPINAPPSSMRTPSATGTLHSRPPSTDPSSNPPGDKDGAYSVRSIPVKIFLPQGPVMQDLAPPYLEDGLTHTLQTFLQRHLPLLFPSSSPSEQSEPLAYAMVQGVVCSGDAELGWLGACLAGADGWVNICIGLVAEP